MRHVIFNTAAYVARHIRLTHQWIERLAPLEWNGVTLPLWAVDGQDGAEDKLCVRLSSTWFSHEACLGV